jgi:hypothetical protein
VFGEKMALSSTLVEKKWSMNRRRGKSIHTRGLGGHETNIQPFFAIYE